MIYLNRLFVHQLKRVFVDRFCFFGDGSQRAEASAVDALYLPLSYSRDASEKIWSTFCTEKN